MRGVRASSLNSLSKPSVREEYDSCSESETESIGKMRMISWQGTRLVGSMELRTVLHELSNNHSTENREITFTDLNRKQTRFVMYCASKEALVVDRSFLTLRVSKLGHQAHRPGTNTQMSEIIDGFLFLGSARDLRDTAAVKGRGIRRVVNCAKEWVHNVPEFETISTHWEDKERQCISQGFEDAFLFIDEAKNRSESVLVHCMVGKSRSAALVMAYLMRSHDMTLRDALDHVRSRRIIAKPNNGFMRQLIAYELKLRGSSSLTIDEYKQIFRPLKSELSTSNEQLLTSVAQDFCSTHFDETFFEGHFRRVFPEGTTEQKDVGTFIVAVSLHVSQDKDVTLKLSGLQLQITHISKELARGCKDFFFTRLKRECTV